MKTSKNGSDEREFLHDVASPLGTAMFLADSVLDDIKDEPKGDLAPATRETLENSVQELNIALNRIKALLSERREILISRGVPSERS